MTDSSVKVAKIERKAVSVKVSGDIAKASIESLKDLGMAALLNPAISIIIAAGVIEFLQTVTVKDAVTGAKRPLISQALATTMESTIISTAVLSSIGEGLSALGAQLLLRGGAK